jgi:hypothetical protein
LFEELCNQAQEKIDLFSPRDIANFAWGLVRVKFQCWPLQTKFVKLCMSRLGEFDGESLVLTFWSLVQITELQDRLDKPVRAARYTLCQQVPSLSAPSCKRLWEILATLGQYDIDLCNILDQQTGEWGHLMTPSELGEVLRAGSDLRYRMRSLPKLYHLSFQHMEFSDEMDPKMLGRFVLDFLSSIYCFGSWIEEVDCAERARASAHTLEGEKQQLRDQKRDAELRMSSGQGVVMDRKDIDAGAVLAKDEDADDGEVKSILPKDGPMLNDVALNIMSKIMPSVFANASVAQSMELIMALTAARAYRTTTVVEETALDREEEEEKEKEEKEKEEKNTTTTTAGVVENTNIRDRMYSSAWAKLGNGRSLNDGQIVHLCACYDLMAYDGCPDGCKPPQVLLQCIQERRMAATNKSGSSRGGGGGGSAGGGSGGKRGKIKGAQAKADARQDVYDLLTSMGKECKLTMPEVDVAIPDNRIAIKVVGLEGYAQNDPYKKGTKRNCLSWTALHTRQLRAMRWEPVLIDAEAYKRIATSAKRKDMLCRLLKMGAYEVKKKDDESSRRRNRKKKNRK